MKQGLVWRIGLTLCVLVLAAFYLLPTFLLPPREADRSKTAGGLARILPDARVNLGLDLMGGIHLSLEVESEKAVEASVYQAGQSLQREAADKGILMSRPNLTPGDKLEFLLSGAAKRAELDEIIAKYFSQYSVESAREDTAGKIRYVLALKPEERSRMVDMTVDQALTTIRNRIDQFGVAEPDVRKEQGNNRITIQLPGMDDPKRAVDIIGKTAHLEFRLARPDIKPDARVLPRGTSILAMEHKAADGTIISEPVVVDDEVLLTGEHIADAAPRPDEQGGYSVSLSFDREGGRIFSRVTGDNVGKQLAIVLDGKVHSAPRINEKISGGSASITGNFTAAQAGDLALVLRAGALPAPVKVMEQHTVGPSLGKQSIDMGVTAALIGGIAVVVFMCVYYSLSGVIASLMLILDIGLILAGMAAFGATLTLPGIAGIVLTLGMAVDANVLIFERIREEMRHGLTPLAAVEAGFSRAMLAITDSNLTTVIAAVILYQFGTGPIRGFAVTLTMGILISMFTAIFVSRIIFDIWMSRPGRKLSI